MPRQGNKGKSPSGSKSVKVVLGFSPQLLNRLLRSQRRCIPFRNTFPTVYNTSRCSRGILNKSNSEQKYDNFYYSSPKATTDREYYRQNRTIKLDFMRCQRQVLECFWKSDQKSTLIAGFWTCNEQGTSRGSKPVHIGDLHMGLISHLHCMWLVHIIPLSIIPGPKAPKDFNSFLHLFVDECKKLATGIWAFDSHKNKTFKLHVYLISVHSEMMAIKYIMNFKGPNGKSPCCTCHITGV